MFVTTIIVVLFSPVKYIQLNDSISPSGIGVYIAFAYCICFTIYQIIMCIKYRKKISKLKFTPYYIFLLLGILNFIIMIFFPGYFLIGFIFFLSVLIMYFTIENPDMKLIDEVHKAKELSDNANEEKTLFLYNMTQEIRNTTSKINNDADIILESKDWGETYDSARNIKAEASSFTTMTNDILDVSKLDSSTIKIYNSKYKISILLREVISIYDNLCKNKGLEFRTNIDRSIPETLYGDSIELKQALTNLLNNSVKSTEKGYVELSLNTIIKNDVCRLIITIEDSSFGIKSEELNQVMTNNKNISESYKLITLMNGTMMISSNYGKNTKVKIILDQKIEEIVSKDAKKYDEIYDNKEILVVDDSDASIKTIEKLLKDSNIKVNKCTTGRECIDRIKSKEKYDLILIDEQLEMINGNELLKKIQTIRNFDTKAILLTKDTKYEYTDEYKKLGFVNYIIKPLKKEDFLDKINTCLEK